MFDYLQLLFISFNSLVLISSNYKQNLTHWPKCFTSQYCWIPLKTPHRLLHTMLMAHIPWLRCMFCTRVIVRLKWVGISCELRHTPEQLWRDETDKTGYTFQDSTENHYRPQVWTHSKTNPTFKNKSHFPHLDRHNLLTFITSVFWMWSDLCDPFGCAILLKRYLGRHALIKPSC